MRLTTHPHLVLRLRMTETIHPLPHMLSWHAQWKNLPLFVISIICATKLTVMDRDKILRERYVLNN